MQLSYDTIRAVLDKLLDENYEYAHEYGEPGYSFSYAAETPIFVMADWWCRCGKHPRTGRNKPYAQSRGEEDLIQPMDLHDHASHYPRIFQQMEEQGVEMHFYDEWTVVDDKAYRTAADSYTWQSSILFTEWGDVLTPDDGIEPWIDYVKNDPDRCLTTWSADDLPPEWEKWNGRFESGWHPGQTDDPKKITDDIQAEHPGADILFLLDENSQFYVGFSAWFRKEEE